MKLMEKQRILRFKKFMFAGFLSKKKHTPAKLLPGGWHASATNHKSDLTALKTLASPMMMRLQGHVNKKPLHLCGMFPKIGGFYPQNGWWKIMENPVKVDDLGVPLFLETSIIYF